MSKYPKINYHWCIKCKKCFDVCPSKVYEIDLLIGKPKVANAENCLEMCKKCEKICPVGAIGFLNSEKN